MDCCSFLGAHARAWKEDQGLAMLFHIRSGGVELVRWIRWIKPGVWYMHALPFKATTWQTHLGDLGGRLLPR